MVCLNFKFLEGQNKHFEDVVGPDWSLEERSCNLGMYEDDEIKLV